ncbi:hypothetical protein E2C01_068567 [Portunus trituberculatus]|uniref:Uncharacterized protein n=1 Tax=Portunus trituberculatus TaxID=210409 RepID=A0A5B7HWI3_PORTR|nr:hypothetical protein [Portunus trituberculatus]
MAEVLQAMMMMELLLMMVMVVVVVLLGGGMVVVVVMGVMLAFTCRLPVAILSLPVYVPACQLMCLSVTFWRLDVRRRVVRDGIPGVGAAD